MVVNCRGKTFNREDVECAMERFDRELRNGFRRWKTYSVKANDKHYPPKELLRLIIGNVGNPTGGEPTNRYFRELGFQIATGEVADEEAATLVVSRRVNSTVGVTLSTERARKFSLWTKFDLRGSLEDAKYPGIYAIAISLRDIAGTPFDYVEEIAYFGMTNSKTGLRGRLNAFNNTLRDKSGPGHGGAQRFRHAFEDGEALAKTLYVAICPFKCDVSSIARKDLETMGAVVRAEYVAFADYAEIFGALPKYNDKKKSPKRKG